MTRENVLQKSVKLVVENDINNDSILDSESLSKLADLIVKKLKAKETTSDFLIIILDQKKLIKAVITYKEISKFLDFLLEKSDGAKFIKDLDLNEFVLRYSVNSEVDNIKKALDILTSGVTDIIVVVNNQGQYIGKIKRNNFVETMKLLIN